MAFPKNVLLAPKSLIAELLNDKLQEMKPWLHLNQVDKTLMERKEKYIFLPNDMWISLNDKKRHINKGKDVNGKPIPIEPDHSRPARSAYLYDINSKSWQLFPSAKGFTLRIDLETDGNEIKGWRRRGKAKRRDKWAADGNIKAPKGSDSPFIEIDISGSALTVDKASLEGLSEDDIHVGMKFDGNGLLGFIDKFLDFLTFSKIDLEGSITNKIQGKIINAILSSAEDLFSELSSIGDELIREKSFKLSSSLSVSNLQFQGDRAILSLSDSTDSNIRNVFSYFSHSLSYRYHDLYLMGDENINGTGNRRNNKITGNNSKNIIKGGGGKDLVFGKGGDDRVSGGSGNDRVSGGSGNDRVSGGSGNDRVSGGLGNDKVIGGSGNDRVLGDSGNDEVFGNSGNDRVFGGSGHDNVSGGTGDDSLYGGSGNDSLDGGSGVDIMAGGSGNDRYKVDISEDIVNERANAGNDRVISSADYALGDNIEDLTLTGTAVLGSGNTLDNRLIGNRHNNILYARAGDDYINGQIGDDVMYGGDGDDIIVGVIGQDRSFGEAGNDVLDAGLRSFLRTQQPYHLSPESRYLDGGSGNDTMYGGFGNDTLIGGKGNDIMLGWVGNDTLAGGLGNDEIFGGYGDDLIRGDLNRRDTQDEISGGNDILRGGKGNDRIGGKTGDDQLYGDEGNDELWGGLGNDLLVGGQGEDILIGLTGADTFRFNFFGEGPDTITDFDQLQGDKLEILGTGFADDLEKGVLSADAFVLGSSAVDADDRFIYDQSTSSLFFDADGSGTQAAVKVANLSNNANLIHSDIIIV